VDKQQDTKKFIEDFMKDRERWQVEEKKAQQLENEKIMEYARQQRERELALLGEKKKIEEGKNAIYDKLASQQHEIERAKMELEELRTDLAQEEQEAAARSKEQDQLRQRVRKRLELIEAYQQQVEYKAKRIEVEKQEEDSYRSQVP
jgi:Trichohyalin-plectin-homology domain